jgi:hypothetical protein
MNLDLLCAALGPPATELPPIPPLQPGQTNRQRISTLTAGCGGACHNAQINPLGFAFEHFDGMGKFRDMDNGQPVDSTATVTVGADFDGAYADSSELAVALGGSATVRSCFARHMFRASSGTSGLAAQASEDAFVAFWAAQPAAEQGNIAETLVAYVKSTLFAQRRLP